MPVTTGSYPSLSLGSAAEAKDGEWWHIDEDKIVSKSDKTSDKYITQVKKYHLTTAGQSAKSNGTVPEVYLSIKISLDGGNTFSEPLKINPVGGNDKFKNFKFAGDATKIQLRQLFIPFSGVPSDELIKGNSGKLPAEDVWWTAPMGHIKENTVQP